MNPSMDILKDQDTSTKVSEVNGVVEVNPTHISPIDFTKDLVHGFKHLDSLDLNESCEVVSDWKREVKRTKNFIKYVVKSEDDLNEGLAFLKARNQNPDFGIKELKLSYRPLTRPYNSFLLTQFIKEIPRLSLGKLVFKNPTVGDLNPRALEEIINRFPNLFHFEDFCSNKGPNVYNFLVQVKDPTTGRMRETYFLNMRELYLPESEVSLDSILRHFPNLKCLTLRKLASPFYEYGDGSRLERLDIGVLNVLGCQQLEALGLSLTTFSGDISEDKEDGIELKNPNIEKVRSILEALRGFLITQASTLKELSLDFFIYWKDDAPKFDLFPCLLPNVIKLETRVECSPTINHILESVPQLESLTLERTLYHSKIPNSFYHEGRAHHGVKALTFLGVIIEPTNLPSIAPLFPNLSSLNLGDVGHGLLPFVYKEFPNLTSLEVQEIKDTLQITDFNSKSKPKGPGIRDMKKLKHLKFLFHNDEMIRDSILIYGLLDVLEQLEILTFEKAKFSENAVDLIESRMELKSEVLELSEDGYYSGDFEFIRRSSGDTVDGGS